MKIKVAADSFRRVVTLCAGVADFASSKPILKSVLLSAPEAGEEVVIAEATDAEISIRVQINAEVIRAGRVCVAAKTLRAVDSVWDEEVITLTDGKNQVEAVGNKLRYEFAKRPADEHPGAIAADVAGGAECVLSAADLKSQISDVTFATARTDDQRWAVGGVLVEFVDGGVSLVATDTKRLGLRKRAATERRGAGQCIVPRKFLDVLGRSLPDDAEPVMLGLSPSGSHIKATSGGLTVAGLTRAGKFPPYAKLIPAAGVQRFELPGAEFFDRVRAATATLDGETKRIDLEFSAGELALSAGNDDIGRSEVTMSLPDYQGPAVRIGCDAGYLREMLRHYANEPGTIRCELVNRDKPMVFRRGDGRLHLIMPMASE